jgi:ribosomal-protein-alanine N-acetyltransferase
VTTTAPARGDDRSRIRPAERADLLAIYRIEKASFPQPWPYEVFDRFLGEPGFLVATEAGAVVGYVVADVVPNHGRAFGHVKDLAVHTERRGEGYGRRLLAQALTRLAEADATSVKLEVREGNDPARNLYRDFGFQTLRRVEAYYDDGDDAFVMVRELDDWGRRDRDYGSARSKPRSSGRG